MKMPDLNYRRWLIACVCLFIFGVLFGFVAFPKILKMGIKKNSVLTPDTDLREMWTVVPFALDFKVYLFNVTNPDEVMKGGKPHVQQVGPYWFDEYKKKVNLNEDPEADTIEFNAVDTFFFNKEKSGGLTGDEEIIFPNVLLLGMAIAVSWDRAPMLPLIATAINELWHNPTTVFMRVRVMDLLFDGLDIDCSSQEFAAKAVCSAFDTDAPQVIRENETTFKFSFFAAKNGSESPRLKVFRGKKNLKDVGRVIEYDEEDELDAWDGEYCNTIRGTEGTVFPPYLNVGEEVFAFSASLCRSVPIHHVGKSKVAGIPTATYTLDFADPLKHEEHQCFCRDPPEGCLPAGLLDMAPCMEAPLVVSLPHFLTVTDQKTLNGVSGLNPNDEEHRTRIEFEKTTGSPVVARQKVQFNLAIEPIQEVEQMKDLPEVLLPIFWIEEGVALNKTYTNMIKHQLIWVVRGNKIIRYLCIVMGVIGGAASGYMLTQKKVLRRMVEPTENKVEVIGGAISDMGGGKTDGPMSFVGQRY